MMPLKDKKHKNLLGSPSSQFYAKYSESPCFEVIIAKT